MHPGLPMQFVRDWVKALKGQARGPGFNSWWRRVFSQASYHHAFTLAFNSSWNWLIFILQQSWQSVVFHINFYSKLRSRHVMLDHTIYYKIMVEFCCVYNYTSCWALYMQEIMSRLVVIPLNHPSYIRYPRPIYRMSRASNPEVLSDNHKSRAQPTSCL